MSPRPTRIHCVTLPVDDLKRSLAFYRDGLGLPADNVPEDADHAPLVLPGGLYLVLTLRSDFTTFTKLAGRTDAPKGTVGCILSFFTADRSQVDALLQAASVAGGTVPGPAQERDWGYGGFVTDPDGHLWEILFNPHFATES
ncbi:VOC family protein [Melittangium boletus]|uniref:VOC domain-containing protein n=1 Tax=Melittangium boletus DSM 14713 TaxID=1294270 RepID=A0A250II20_9BACT|nr:VOC family protein [Melittangium boletus]ATB30811.1 hypothetical protein MEBOL_004273 [Melittangium boletus DSM 14713]